MVKVRSGEIVRRVIEEEMSMWRRKEVDVRAPIQVRGCALNKRGKRSRRKRRSAGIETLCSGIVER